MKRFMASIFCISTLLLSTSFGHASSKHVFGWVEEGQILPERIAVKMKFDTGALNRKKKKVQNCQLKMPLN